MRIIILLFNVIFLFSACKVKDYQSDSRPITHEMWDSLLQQYVSEDGKVNYQGFKRDSVRLNEYLNLLSKNHPSEQNWSREEQLAYWINAYNAFTVKLIVDNYPVQSIKDIKKGIAFVNSVWDIKFIQIEDRSYDLNNIEHGILRPKFKEPRIHFAINCASASCPKLLNRAYNANRLDKQLDEAAQAFLADPFKNKIAADRIEISKIFSWFQGDFGDVIDFINRYSTVKINRNAKVEHLEYDWSLNEG